MVLHGCLDTRDRTSLEKAYAKEWWAGDEEAPVVLEKACFAGEFAAKRGGASVVEAPP